MITKYFLTAGYPFKDLIQQGLTQNNLSHISYLTGHYNHVRCLNNMLVLCYFR